MATSFPHSIPDVQSLEELLSDPPDYVVDTMRQLEGDLLILGVAGKMGPTLARMARRASTAAGATRRIIGVARFSDEAQQQALQSAGIETLRCDLLSERDVARLPDAPNILFMAGRKFGSTGLESLTWAMNTYVPALICRRFAASRIVAFSTGNVYGLVDVRSGGSSETDTPRPLGEYAMSCLGRERMFDHFSRTFGTRAAILRLNYAIDMRYGVLVDLASRILAGQTIDVTMGYFNAIWQADANAMALASLAHVATPPLTLNVAGPEQLSVRDVATQLGRRLNRSVSFSGREASDALLSNGSKSWSLFGKPRVSIEQLIDWTADWVMRGGTTLAKPTHFEARDGRF